MLKPSRLRRWSRWGRRARAADQIEVETNGQRLWSRECREEFVPDEIAVLLGCTKVAAAARYDTACRAADLPGVKQAWRAGRVDCPQGRA